MMAPNQFKLSHRPVERGDIESLCAFAQTSEELFYLFPKANYPLTPDQLKRAISERTENTVVLLDDALAGFANFYEWEPNGVCAIGNVMIDPNLRGQGLGAYLIKVLSKVAFTKHNARTVHISCFCDNTAGLALYEKLGFQKCGEERRFDKTGNITTLINLELSRNDWIRCGV